MKKYENWAKMAQWIAEPNAKVSNLEKQGAALTSNSGFWKRLYPNK
jgi:hypothetical protein